MHTVALRDLQQNGLKAIDSSSGEPILLQGRSGPAYFLVPAQKTNLEGQLLELERAMALSNLHNWQQKAKELGLDQMSLEDINLEINASRKHQK